MLLLERERDKHYLVTYIKLLPKTNKDSIKNTNNLKQTQIFSTDSFDFKQYIYC